MTKAQAKAFEIIWLKAQLAGMEAGRACSPTPMRVIQRANPLDDSSEVKQYWDVPDGPCGFASVIVKPGGSSFARWLKKYEPNQTYQNYYGGLSYSIWAYGQSYERKTAHAHAMARVLNENGIRAYADGRLD